MRRPTLSLPSSLLPHSFEPRADRHSRVSRQQMLALCTHYFRSGTPHIFVIVSLDRHTDKLTGYGVPQSLISGCPTVLLMRVFPPSSDVFQA